MLVEDYVLFTDEGDSRVTETSGTIVNFGQCVSSNMMNDSPSHSGLYKLNKSTTLECASAAKAARQTTACREDAQLPTSFSTWPDVHHLGASPQQQCGGSTCSFTLVHARRDAVLNASALISIPTPSYIHCSTTQPATQLHYSMLLPSKFHTTLPLTQARPP